MARRNYTRTKKRGFKVPTQSYIRRRKGSKAQSKQIAMNAKAITKLSKKVLKYSQYNYSESTSWFGTSSYKFNQWIVPASWVKIFQSQSEDALQQIARVLTLNFKMFLQAGSGFTTPACVTVFCVTVKKKVSRQFMIDTGNGTVLVEGEHYVNVSTGNANNHALWMLNKDIFNIHYHKSMLMGQSPFYQNVEEVYNTSIKDANRKLSWSVNYNKTLKSDNSGTADVGWKSLTTHDIQGNDMVFTYVFSNQPSLDEMYMDVNCLIKVQTVV